MSEDVPIDERSLGDLVATATRDVSELVRKELELAKAELAQEAKKAAKAGALFGVAGAVGGLGMLWGVVAGTVALNRETALPDWAGWLCVGLLFVVVAGGLGTLGLLRVATFKGPVRTKRSLQTSAAWLRHPTEAPPDPELEDLRASH